MSLIQKMRKKSDDKKRVFALSVSFALTLLIASFWMISVFNGFNNKDSDIKNVAGVKSFLNLKSLIGK